MDAFQAIDALSAAFYALIGLWAAADPRHWFIRFAVMIVLLLIVLFIPAYELAVLFGIELTVILTGVWLYRARRGWRPRLSLGTALLTMVVVAVTAAVIGRLPSFHPGQWAYFINSSVFAALAALITQWLVCSTARVWVRILVALFAFTAGLVLYYVGVVVEKGLWSFPSTPWQVTAEKQFQWAEIKAWLQERLPTLLVMFGILMIVVMAANASGWFRTKSADERLHVTGRTAAARCLLAVMALSVAAPMGWLFYELLTPSPIPQVTLPEPNGFNDFLAAGLDTPGTARGLAQSRFNPTRDALEAAFRDFAPIADRIDEGLSKQCLVPLYAADRQREDRDFEALSMASFALMARLLHVRECGNNDQLCRASLQLIRYTHESRRGATLRWENLGYNACDGFNAIRHRVGDFSLDECRKLVEELCDADDNQEPFKLRLERQLIIDQNKHWIDHLNQMLERWSRKPHYEGYVDTSRYINVDSRLLIAELAAQAFTREHHRPPNSLEELVPAYMPRVPLDAYGKSYLQYRRDGARYVIYSVGQDGEDDQGRESLNAADGLDDIPVRGPRLPSFWYLKAIGAAAKEIFPSRQAATLNP